jgi:hypothetical protein
MLGLERRGVLGLRHRESFLQGPSNSIGENWLLLCKWGRKVGMVWFKRIPSSEGAADSGITRIWSAPLAPPRPARKLRYYVHVVG